MNTINESINRIGVAPIIMLKHPERAAALLVRAL